MSGVAPQNDEHGRPIHLELCPVCDTGDMDRPAAGLLVQWFADGGGHDESRVKEGSHLRWSGQRSAWLPSAGTCRSPARPALSCHRQKLPGASCRRVVRAARPQVELLLGPWDNV
ncbi:DUF6300 family protein [Streptomyces sp. NPDC005329]|uniref:DUF6300 family protein n=1 Tax=Streptomyces sp. NPDC005329 TaxID=3157034 RepID=UPI0033B89CDA